VRSNEQSLRLHKTAMCLAQEKEEFP
jgi:hypothetical protein